IVGADEEHDAARVQRDDVLIEADEDAPGRVAAYAPVGRLDARETAAHIRPALSDRVAHEHQGPLVLLNLRRPLGAPLDPDRLEPFGAADGACTRQALVRGGNLEVALGRGRW